MNLPMMGRARMGCSTEPRNIKVSLPMGIGKASGTSASLVAHVCYNRHMLDNSATARLGPQGRVVIPARVRAELQLKEGQELSVWIENGAVMMQNRADVIKSMRGMFKNPSAGSVVDELIADRRKSARREHKDRS
jgi:AbrB family looped-hinge helix DNA binding protein